MVPYFGRVWGLSVREGIKAILHSGLGRILPINLSTVRNRIETTATNTSPDKARNEKNVVLKMPSRLCRKRFPDKTTQKTITYP